MNKLKQPEPIEDFIVEYDEIWKCFYVYIDKVDGFMDALKNINGVRRVTNNFGDRYSVYVSPRYSIEDMHNAFSAVCTEVLTT